MATGRQAYALEHFDAFRYFDLPPGYVWYVPTEDVYVLPEPEPEPPTYRFYSEAVYRRSHSAPDPGPTCQATRQGKRCQAPRVGPAFCKEHGDEGTRAWAAAMARNRPPLPDCPGCHYAHHDAQNCRCKGHLRP